MTTTNERFDFTTKIRHELRLFTAENKTRGNLSVTNAVSHMLNGMYDDAIIHLRVGDRQLTCYRRAMRILIDIREAEFAAYILDAIEESGVAWESRGSDLAHALQLFQEDAKVSELASVLTDRLAVENDEEREEQPEEFDTSSL